MSEPEIVRPVLRNRGTHQVGQYEVRLLERLVLPIRIEGNYPGLRAFFDGLIDTACPLPLLFARTDWMRFAPAIAWFSPEIEAGLPEELRHSHGAGGGLIEYRLGIVRLTVCDLAAKIFRPLPPQLAAFAVGDDVVGPPLIGLGGGILHQMPLYLDLYLRRARLG